MQDYFAQKSLAASLLKTPVRKIESIEVLGDYALVLESGAVYPVAIELAELETEHDRQRRERGQQLPILATDPETGATYFGTEWPASLHLASLDSCDCQDFTRQRAAGRDRLYCKHVAALQWQADQVAAAILSENRYRTIDQAAVEAAAAYQDLFGEVA